MKFFKTLCLLIIFMLLLVVGWAWTPDTQFKEMREKYANSFSSFINLPNGERLHYRDQGNKSGPTLLFIHGTSASLHTWEPLIESLENNYRFISLDLPGHGLTGVNRDADYSMAKFVASIDLLMKTKKLSEVTLVGNSLGGAVAWESALTLGDIKSLILIAPSGAPKKVKSESNFGFQLLSSPIGPFLINHFTPRSIIKKSIHQTVYDASQVDDETVDRYWELLRLKGNRQAMLDLSKTPRNEASPARLNKIKQPTLIIWGSDDSILTLDMSELFDVEILNSSLFVLPNVGHLPMEEDVEGVSAKIQEFLESSY